MSFGKWFRRMKDVKQGLEANAVRKAEGLEEEAGLENSKAVSLEIVKNELLKINVPRLNLHHTNSGSYQNFVKCYEACLEDIFGTKDLGIKEKSEQLIQVITLITQKLCGRMITESGYDEYNPEEMDYPREERLIIGFQENLLAAIYVICERYHVAFWKVLEKNLEYEIVEIDNSSNSYEVVHPVLRLSMQALLAIPSFIEDEEKHENAVLTVEDELRDHFDFFMENFKRGDIRALKDFINEEAYLLSNDFEEILSDYLESVEDVEDEFVIEEGLHELVEVFPNLVTEICVYTLNDLLSVATFREISFRTWCDKESYDAYCQTFKELLQTMADFKEYQGVPFTWKKEEWQLLLAEVMDELDGHMLNFAISILEDSFGIHHEEIDEFITDHIMTVIKNIEGDTTLREKTNYWEELIYLLTNDIVYQVVSYENPSLIQ